MNDLGKAAIAGPEIKAVETHGITFPSNPEKRDGYQLRFLLEHAPGIEQWTPRMYLTNDAAQDLLQLLTDQLHSEGHLAPGISPGKLVQ